MPFQLLPPARATFVVEWGLLRTDKPVRTRRRRGSAAIVGVILLALVAGMLAFAIDIGFAKSTRSEIQRTSDAAAMAGGWQLLEEKQNGTLESTMLQTVAAETQYYANLNPILGDSPNLNVAGTPDYQVGRYDWATRVFTQGAQTIEDYNAVRVVVKRSTQSNGAVPLFFSSLFGYTSVDMENEAIAAMSNRVIGFELPAGSDDALPIMPFALDLETWQEMLAGEADDDWGYHPDFGVTPGGDGILEVNLYPQSTGSPGNRGTIDIGASNNSTSDLARQIVSGISAEDLSAMNQQLTIPSADEPLLMEGDPGISAGLKDELASIIGETRVIPVFSSVSGNGDNSYYSIIKLVGIRVLDVKLTGTANSKCVMVQPATMIVRGAVIDTSGNGETSDYIYTPVTLVK